MKSIPLHRVAFVRPFARFLEEIGAPVERGFRQADLPWCALQDVDNYVPSHCFWKFLVNMVHTEGVLDLGFLVGQKYGADCADPRMSALLVKAPTLYQGLLRASELINRTVTNCHVGIKQPPNNRYAYFYHLPSCSVDNPAIEQIGWFGLMTMLDMVRVYTGSKWQPSEIGLMTDRMPDNRVQEYFPAIRIRLSCFSYYIALEHAVLSLSPVSNKYAREPLSSPEYKPLPDDFVGALEYVLEAFIEEQHLSAEFAASLCSMSKRTMQRRLKIQGTDYHSVLGHARFNVAKRLLQNTDLTIGEISHRLGYSDVSHFARYFKRTAGLTPKLYRQQDPQH